jgi:serine protease AprX
MRRWLVLCALLLTLSGSTFTPPARIDPRVLEDTAEGATARFIVILKAQPNTRALVATEANRAARGRIVFDALRRAAQATQPALRAQLDALGARYRAFTVVNAFVVEGNRAVVDALAARSDVPPSKRIARFAWICRARKMRPPRRTESSGTSVKSTRQSVWALGYTGQNIRVRERGYRRAMDASRAATALSRLEWRGESQLSLVGRDSFRPERQWHQSVWLQRRPRRAMITDTARTRSASALVTMARAIRSVWRRARAGSRVAIWKQGWGSPSTYLECFDFFLAPWDLNQQNPDVNQRPDVVGNSYACTPAEGCTANTLLAAMDNLRAAGIFMAVAAGNSGPSCATINEPPAIYDSAITVGATEASDAIASFSSRGPVTVDGSNRRKPDVVAPGVVVRSSVPTDAYGYRSGTSMATPHVAGAVALLWSAFPSLRRNVDLTESVLAITATRLPITQLCGDDSAGQYPNNVQGHGRIDVYAAYDYYARVGLPPYVYYFPFVAK